MKWLCATLGLLAAAAALVVAIYLRDYSSSWRLPPREAAGADAQLVLDSMAGPQCGNLCSYEIVGHPRTDHWLAKIVDRSHPARCVDIDIETFGTGSEHDPSGIKPVSCDSIGSASNF
jgi:hypothetical protein